MSGNDDTTTAHDPEESTGTILELDGVAKDYGPESVIQDLSLSVREGEILTVLGPSGCGKTTTLRLVAGLERPDAGEVRIRSDPVAGDGQFVAPEQRDVGVVFQEFALFPHLTAAENVGFGLTDRPDDEREARVSELLDLVDLADQREAYPDELSGGQQQRVALARSLAPEPEILLLDEPFSNLDVDLRIEMREEVRRILKEAGVTAISVTHDQEEAMSVSDRVAVMQAGRIVQVGEPEQVFQHPESRFVAGFLGHASFLSGFVSGDVVQTDLGTVPREQIHGLAEAYDKTRIDVLVRPDDVRARELDLDETADPDDAADGHVVHRRYLGPTVLYRVELANGDRLEVMHNHTDEVGLDAPVAVELAADHDLAWFPKEMDPDGTEVVAAEGVGQAAADGGAADGDAADGDTIDSGASDVGGAPVGGAPVDGGTPHHRRDDCAPHEDSRQGRPAHGSPPSPPDEDESLDD